MDSPFCEKIITLSFPQLYKAFYGLSDHYFGLTIHCNVILSLYTCFFLYVLLLKFKKRTFGFTLVISPVFSPSRYSIVSTKHQIEKYCKTKACEYRRQIQYLPQRLVEKQSLKGTVNSGFVRFDMSEGNKQQFVNMFFI